MVIFLYQTLKFNAKNKIKNFFVAKRDVKKILKKINIPFEKKVRYNFSESFIQKHLETELPKYFITVKREVILKRGGRIDFDIGNGAIGLEIKLTKSLNAGAKAIRSLEGQLREYIRVQYKKRNLLLAIYGTKQENKIFLKDKYNLQMLKEVGVCFVLIELK